MTDLKTQKSIKSNKVEQQNLNLYYLIFIVLLTVIVYSNSLHNDFTNWDDHKNIHENPDIKALSGENIKKIFSTFYVGMYQPLVTLSFAAEYHFFKYDPFFYHLDNLILHIVNVILVFMLIFKISGRREISFIVSLLFAIHPMHVESVAWISERKDVMYSLFYLTSIIFYLRYIDKLKVKNKKSNNIIFNNQYILSISFFILSLLSKSAAITLPVLLLLFDYYYSRLTIKSIIEKIPFFILSLIFIIITFHSQTSALIPNTAYVKPFNRIFLASYAISYYLIRLVLPFNLSAIHPFRGSNIALPKEYYFSFIVIVAICVMVIFIKRFRKEILFGLIFFLITVSLVIQIIPFGESIVSERYTYIPYLGLFFIIGYFADFVYTKFALKKGIRVSVIIIIFGLTGYYSILSYNRNKIWKNNVTLWTDALSKTPASLVCLQLGLSMEEEKKYKEALTYLNNSIKLDSTDGGNYNERGILKGMLNDYKGAIVDFDKAIKLRPNLEQAKKNRLKAITYMEQDKDTLINNSNSKPASENIKKLKERFDSFMKFALEDYSKNNFTDAIKNVNEAMKLNNKIPEAYYYRGMFKFNNNDYKGATEDYSKAILLKPDFTEAYNNRGYTDNFLKDYKHALEDCNKAIQLKPDLDEAYNTRGFTKFNIAINQHAASAQLLLKEAIDDFNKATELNAKNFDAIYNRGNARFSLNDKTGACEDWKKVVSETNDKTSAEAKAKINKYCKT